MVFLYMRGASGVYYWFGKGSGADDLIDALGGVDVATQVGLAGSRPINAEGLVKSASRPLHDDEPRPRVRRRDRRSDGGSGRRGHDAGVNGCVVDMSDYEVLSFGPQFPSTLRALGHAIYDEKHRSDGRS